MIQGEAIFPRRTAVLLATVVALVSFVAGWASSSAQGKTGAHATTTFAESRAEAQRLRRLAPFVGAWERHGGGINIDASGSGTATWRIYQWCSDDPTPPCDRIVGHLIIGGGNAVIMLTDARGKSAHGYVLTSSDPATMPIAEIAVELRSGGHLLVPGLGRLCGAKARWDCGA